MITAQAIHLGPIMLPWGLTILMLAILMSVVIGKFSFQYFSISNLQWAAFKDSIWSAFLVGLLSARAGFVLLNLDVYLEHPIEILKIQDKGFHLYVGIACAGLWMVWKNRSLKKIFIALCFAAFALFLISGQYFYQQVQLQYQQFPQVNLVNLQQEHVELTQFLGKPTVINLWASWCPPCRREMPVLNDAQQRYPNVQFVFINQNEDAKTVQTYLQQHKLNLHWVLLDFDGVTAQKMGMFGLPSTLFFNAQGKLIDTHMGELTHAALHQKVQRIVSE
ncbi:TlpA disulfide reductase family protein [Acinetobacter guillouiae]|uniref:TlpA disulfide reductase family protein n=1 Tax=Acinetobacter guillouiae TaxID=106649 RepID=UPI00125F1694|nr:TlpA disulfide reductase family protein [Acinetobacter guillouiae]